MGKSKAILVVFTGGTIGSVVNKGVIGVDSSARYDLLNRFSAEWNGAEVEFETIQPFSILSENAVLEDWQRLISVIRKTDLDKYEGVIITHGTDTLSYTAAALSFALYDIGVPIVLVSSCAPLPSEKSNGLVNFINAVEFILGEEMAGVFVIYQNPDSKVLLHLGSRLTEALPYTHAFRSENDSHLGHFDSGKLVLNPAVAPEIVDCLKEPEGAELGLSPVFSDEILYISPYPGMNYQYFNFSTKKPRAILHGMYHSGTGCVHPEQDKYSMLEFVSYCRDFGVMVYLAPVGRTENVYETAKELSESGVIPVYNTSTVAALVKLMLLYGNYSDDLKVKNLMSGGSIFYEEVE